MIDQKLIEEIAERINSMRERNAYYYLRENGELVTHEAFADSYAIAAELTKYYQPKLSENSTVLSKEEYNNYINLKELLDKGYFTSENRVAIHNARKQVVEEVLELLDGMKVKEDDRHQWRENHNDCIEKCKVKIIKKFGVAAGMEE